MYSTVARPRAVSFRGQLPKIRRVIAVKAADPPSGASPPSVLTIATAQGEAARPAAYVGRGEKAVEPLTQLVLVDAARDVTAHRQAHGPALLADHDGHRVGLLGDAQGRAMARAVVLERALALGQRQHHTGRHDLVALHQHGPVVKRIARREERSQQLRAEVGVDGHACLGHIAKAGVSLDDDERTGAPSRELGGRGREQAGHPLVVARSRATHDGHRTDATDPVEATAQLRLEDDHEGHEADHGAGLEDAREQTQVQLAGDDVDGVDDGRADGQAHRASALDEAQHEIDQDCGQEDVEQCARFDPQIRG